MPQISYPSRQRISLGRLLGLPGTITYDLYALVMTGIDTVIAGPLQKRLGKMQHMAYFFLLPNLLIFGIFVLFPMLLNFYFAFTGGSRLFPSDRPFVGIENFQSLFSCTNFLNPNSCVEDKFWRGVLNTFWFVSLQVSCMILISLLTALILNRKIVARGFFRSVFFYPVLLSPVVVALIWKWILQREGVLNVFVTALGGQADAHLLSVNGARFWLITISVWAQMGFFTLILLAGLQSIPAELYEAGAMDGAGRRQSFRHITLPLLTPTLLVVIVLSVIRAVQVFDQVFVLTGGGPGTATLYTVQYIYDTAFGPPPPRYGIAAAASVVLGIALLIFTLIQLRAGRNSESA